MKRIILKFFILINILSLSAFAETPDEIISKLDSMQNQLFSPIIEYSRSLNCELYLGGGTLLDMINFKNENYELIQMSDIFKPGQDIDLLVEGSRGNRDKIKIWLENHFPDYKWDIGLRRFFENEDYIKQNSDSISTTFLQLSENRGGSKFLDLRQKDYNPDYFLSEISKRNIHFISSHQHIETKMYLENKNPPIFSAMRYINNTLKTNFNYAEKDISKIKTIIDKFDYDSEILNSVAERRYNELLIKLNTLLLKSNDEKLKNLVGTLNKKNNNSAVRCELIFNSIF